MAPEVSGQVLLDRCVEKEVLKLRECEKGGSNDDIDTEHVQASVVEEEWVLERKEAEFI